MNAYTLLPHDMTDLSVSVRKCHDPYHAHKNPDIEVMSFTWRGASVVIESEAGSGRYNVKIGNVTAVQLTEHAARMFLFEHMERRP